MFFLVILVKAWIVWTKRTGAFGRTVIWSSDVDPQTLQRRQVFFSGNVQGVGFRYTARSVARGFEVTGFVRNLVDRRVELIAEGPAHDLEGFLAALGERMSGHIRHVDCDSRPAIGEFVNFDIRY